MLSLEEMGKAAILRELCASSDSADRLVKNWSRYRKHIEKNFLALLPDLIWQGASRLQEFRGLFEDETAGKRATYDTVKQLGFYTDCCGDAHWSIPAEVIDREIACALTALASALTRDKENINAEELRLWALHMGRGMTRENLLDWCAAMVAAGLKPSDYLDEMRRFTLEFENPGERA
jgi:AbiV family abortive infection protein